MSTLKNNDLLSKGAISLYLEKIFFLKRPITVLLILFEKCIHYTYFRIIITKTSLFKYTETLTAKTWKFSDKNSEIFHISAQNIDGGYSLIYVFEQK